MCDLKVAELHKELEERDLETIGWKADLKKQLKIKDLETYLFLDDASSIIASDMEI